jgi:hypothetical protein
VHLISVALTYVFAMITFISGWLMLRQPVSMFYIVETPHPLHAPQWLNFFKMLHSYSNIVLGGLGFLQVAGVLNA